MSDLHNIFFLHLKVQRGGFLFGGFLHPKTNGAAKFCPQLVFCLSFDLMSIHDCGKQLEAETCS